MRFKIDVSDRETGEVATLDVDAPSAQAARRHLREAGYMVWATEPIRSSPNVQSPVASKHALLDRLAEEAQHARFGAHPVRFLLFPLLRLTGGALLWLSAASYFLHLHLPQGPYKLSPTPGNLAMGAMLFWIAGLVIGLPVARGRAARRAWADAQIVCRYCRHRGNVRTFERILTRRRLWGQCSCCGIRWAL
jgi:hypothetical protein